MNKVKSNLIVLLLSTLLCGLISIYLGKDLSWDVANYHFYNPFAFLHHRANFDYWPQSFIHVYFTPTIDFLSYFLITHFSPWMTQFISGAIHGLNLWLLYLIAKHFLNSATKINLFAIFLALLGIYSAMVILQIGGFENDNTVSIFVLSFILLQLHAFHSKKLMVISGFLLGAGIGIKLTAAVFLIGAIAAYLFLPISFINRFKAILLLIIASSMGMIISSGYWMWILWTHYQNPFFPFYNAIFKSPYFPLINFHYNKFLPQNIWHSLFYPFYFSWSGTLGDTHFRDLRFAILFILFIMYGVVCLWRWYRNKKASPDLATHWLFSFIIFSYLVWEYYFAIVRYLAPITMLAPLLIYLLIKKMIMHERARLVILTGIFYSMIFTLQIPPIIRAPWYDSTYFAINMPNIIQPNNSLVLVAYPAYALSISPRPQTYLIPFFPKNFHFAGIPLNDKKSMPLTDTEQKNISTLIKQYQHHLYLLASDDSMSALYQAVKNFGVIKNGNCAEIKSDRQILSNTKTLICPVKLG